MTHLESLVDIQFDRGYGIQHIDMPDGRVITSVSQPDWTNLMHALRSPAIEKEPGDFIVTPELVSIAGVYRNSPAELEKIVRARDIEAEMVSQSFPDTMLLLGSIALADSVRPRNVVKFIQNGAIQNESPKINYQGGEYGIYDPGVTAADVRLPTPDVMNIIGADVQMPPPIEKSVKTLVVSACWGLPRLVREADSQRQKDLTYNINRIFARNDSVETVVMVDRDPLRPNADGRPFNAVARRIRQSEPQ